MLTTLDNDPDTFINFEWNPSPEALDAYMKRETILARSNLRVLDKAGVRGRAVHQSTLHSSETLRRAQEAPCAT